MPAMLRKLVRPRPATATAMARGVPESRGHGAAARRPRYPAYLSRRLEPGFDVMIPGDAGRRDLFRSVFGDWLERLVEETERKFVQRRYVRPPGALPELAFLSA